MELPSALKDLSEHGDRICSALPLKTWYELLVRKVENVLKIQNVLESEELISQTRSVLVVDAKMLHLAAGIYSSVFHLKRRQHMSMAECAIYF